MSQRFVGRYINSRLQKISTESAHNRQVFATRSNEMEYSKVTIDLTPVSRRAERLLGARESPVHRKHPCRASLGGGEGQPKRQLRRGLQQTYRKNILHVMYSGAYAMCRSRPEHLNFKSSYLQARQAPLPVLMTIGSRSQRSPHRCQTPV